MLAESIIRIGRPIVESELSNQERIRWLTDVSSENCKNYFQNVFVIEIDDSKGTLFQLQVGQFEKDRNKENFIVDQNWNTSFPILYPNGGNPLHAQGIYPLPCYLMYDPHIKAMDNPDEFIKDVLIPRLNNTVSYKNQKEEERKQLIKKVRDILENKSQLIATEEKQLGVIVIYDHQLPVFQTFNERKEDPTYLWLSESRLKKNTHLYLNGDVVLDGIVESRFEEASTLGSEEQAVSTFTNTKVDKVVSIYNKSWLWLSPTWEMPRSIYWGKDEWTKGIKVDRDSYQAFLYGAQFLKQITVPISSGILKEMFAPVTSVEAKKHMKSTSFDTIFGVPMVLPLIDKDSQQIYSKYRRMLKNNQQMNQSDLHLEILAGIKNSIVPDSSDEHRLSILYYSGDLSRGNMHIRAMIEDVIPSVASEIQKILVNLKRRGLKEIREMFGIKSEEPMYRIETLPSLLANAYGPGYVWSSLQNTFHRKPLTIHRLKGITLKKLNELGSKQDEYGMKQELIFYYSFLYFISNYEITILKIEKGVKGMAEWKDLLDRYYQGIITHEDMNDSETLGFITGLLLKQFSQSYYQKTRKDFVKHRVMRFGSKLTPEMLWKNGLIRCEELAEQWDMGLNKNFHTILAEVLIATLDSDKDKKLNIEKDNFMTAFWSGYLMYKKQNMGFKEA